MIYYFNIKLNKSIITNPTFCRVLKIFIIFFSHNKFFIKMLFYHATIFTFFNRISNKRMNNICWIDYQHILIYNHNWNQNYFDIYSYKTHLDFVFHYFLLLKCFQSQHQSHIVFTVSLFLAILIICLPLISQQSLRRLSNACAVQKVWN